MKLLTTLLIIAYVLASITFLSTGKPGGTILGLCLLGAAFLLYYATEAVKHLRDISHSLRIAVTETVEDQEIEPEEIELEVKGEVPTDSDTTYTTSSGKKLRGQ